MRFVLEFDLHTENDGHTERVHEIIRTIGKVGDAVHNERHDLDFTGEVKTQSVYDINGNRIGGWKVTDDD